MIDIIIPCYNSHDTIDRCLGSLIMQNFKQFKVTLVNDGGKDYKDVIERYSPLINIREIGYSENKGIGYARNYGIENTNEDYFMFIDSDDVLFSMFSLDELNVLLKDKNNVVVISGIAQEVDNHKLIYKQKNTNFLHGKIFKRSYIQKNKIKFLNSSCCEDAGFLTICLLCLNHKTTRMVMTDAVTYGWLHNPNSVGRKNFVEWEYSIVPIGYIENLVYAFDTLRKRHIDSLEIVFNKVVYMIKLIIMYANNLEKQPQYEEINQKALTKYYNKVYKGIKLRVTETILQKALTELHITEEDKIKISKILSVLDRLGA